MPSGDRQPDLDRLLLDAAIAGTRIAPPRTVAEWADAERMVAAESGSPWPGQWTTRRVPYLREPMEVMSLSHPARRVTFVKAAQLGGSEAALNMIGQIMSETPVPMLVMLPSIDMMRGYNRLKLDPMISGSPVLSRRVENVVSRDEDASTTTFKSFPGGYLQLVTANSSSNLQMRTARVLVLEEVSEYPFDVNGRGDPVEQLENRTTMFAGREKIVEVSTPGDEDTCRITASYLRSSRGQYLVPCPHCGERQTLEWENLRWPKGRSQEAKYHCVECGAEIDHAQKPAMLLAGGWVHAVPDLVSTHPGYTLSGLYSPTLSWADLASQWERVLGDEAKVKNFVQQRLGRTWRVAGEAPEWQRLYDRREEWTPGTVPAGGLVSTCGVDVQRDRLEASVWAWGRNGESWLIDHIVIAGSPFQWRTWEQCATLLETVYPHELGGALPISLTAVDSSDGVTTAEVYAFTRKVGMRKAIPIKGRDNLVQAIAPGQKIDVRRSGKRIGSLKPWLVGSSYLKGQLYGRLRLDRPTAESGDPFPAGYVHLPVHVAGEEFCRQLVAEELRRTRTRAGFMKMEWVPTRERNEALDCRNYAQAAAVMLGIERWSEARWIEMHAAVERLQPHSPRLQAGLALPSVPDDLDIDQRVDEDGDSDGDGDSDIVDHAEQSIAEISVSAPTPQGVLSAGPPPAVLARPRAWIRPGGAWIR